MSWLLSLVVQLLYRGHLRAHEMYGVPVEIQHGPVEHIELQLHLKVQEEQESNKEYMRLE